MADDLRESSIRDFNKKQRDLSGDKGKSENLELDRQSALLRIKALELQDLQIKDNLTTAEKKSETLLNKLADAQKIREIEARRIEIEKSLNGIQEEFDE